MVAAVAAALLDSSWEYMLLWAIRVACMKLWFLGTWLSLEGGIFKLGLAGGCWWGGLLLRFIKS